MTELITLNDFVNISHFRATQRKQNALHKHLSPSPLQRTALTTPSVPRKVFFYRRLYNPFLSERHRSVFSRQFPGSGGTAAGRAAGEGSAFFPPGFLSPVRRHLPAPSLSGAGTSRDLSPTPAAPSAPRAGAARAPRAAGTHLSGRGSAGDSRLVPPLSGPQPGLAGPRHRAHRLTFPSGRPPAPALPRCRRRGSPPPAPLPRRTHPAGRRCRRSSEPPRRAPSRCRAQRRPAPAPRLLVPRPPAGL